MIRWCKTAYLAIGSMTALLAAPGVLAAENQSESAIIARSQLPASAVGYVVFDLRAKRVVAAKAAKRLFVPASVAKVPTTVAALDMLGPDYRFETRLYLNSRTGSRQRNGRVTGDLYLVGRGDPMLTGDHMLSMVQALAAQGIREVNGRFLYDDSFLSSVSRIANLKPDHAAHNTGVGALSVNFNRFRVTWVRAGKQAVLQTTALSITDRLKVEIGTIGFALGRKRRRSPGPFIYAELGGRDHWIVSPYLRRRGHAWLPVRKAGQTAAAVFHKLGEENGLSLPSPSAGKAPADARLVHAFKGQPLTVVVRRLLYFSNNLAAELTGAVATRSRTKQPLTLAQSGTAMATWFKARMPKTNWTGFVLDNHSGLSLDSRMSPAQVLAILRYAHARKYRGVRYEALLRPYHLRREARPRGRFSVRAKSGTMNYIRGRAGYIRSAGGRSLAFVLFISQAEARRDFNGRGKAAATRIRFGPRRWMHRARRLEHDLIARWVNAY